MESCVAGQGVKTIRKYGFLCRVSGLQWGSEDARLAAELEKGLENVRQRQRDRRSREGGRCGKDAFIWTTGEPDIALELRRLGVEYSRGDDALAERYAAVSRRLLSEEVKLTRCGREGRSTG